MELLQNSETRCWLVVLPSAFRVSLVIAFLRGWVSAVTWFNCLHVDLGLAENGANSRIGVQQVHGSVPSGVQHAVKGELVVGHSVLFQIKVLHRRVPYDFCRLLSAHSRNGLLVFFWRPLLQFLHGPADSLVQQVDKANDLSTAGLELLSVGALNDPKPCMRASGLRGLVPP